MRDRSASVLVAAALVVVSAAAGTTACSLPEDRSERYELPSTTRPPTTVVAGEGIIEGAGAPTVPATTIPLGTPVTVPPGTPNANSINATLLGFEEATTQLDICSAIQRPATVLDPNGGITLPDITKDPVVSTAFIAASERAFAHFAQIVPEAVAKPFGTLALAFQSLARIDPAAPDAGYRLTSIITSTEVRNGGSQVIKWLTSNCGGAFVPSTTTTTAAPEAPPRR